MNPMYVYTKGSGQSAYPNRLDSSFRYREAGLCSGQSAYPNRLDFRPFRVL